jgi:SAM-dependent methyltransferase
MNIATKMKTDWNRRAKHHAQYWIASENFQDDDTFAQSGSQSARALLTALSPYYDPTWMVLDIGCGIGRMLKPLAPHFRHLVGIDVSGEMIKKSQTWLEGLKNVETMETSGVDLSPFPSEHFNLVYSYVAFQHMPRQVFERYVEESNRVLKLHGYLAFQIPMGFYQDAPIEDTIGVRNYQKDEVIDKLQQYGFHVTEEQRAESMTYSDNVERHTSPFLIAKKIEVSQQHNHTNWINTECREGFSLLDTRMWLWFAEQCLQAGHQEEALRTYESLLEHDPLSLEKWYRIVEDLIQTEKIEEAQTTIAKLETALPTYEKLNALLEAQRL